MATRRHILRALSLSTLASTITSTIPMGALAQGEFSTRQLAPNITLISGAGANVVVAEGSSSVVVVNGGLQASAEALLAEINRLTDNKPISALFNTSWRPEFCGLNYLLGPHGTTIIAHENTRLWQNAEFYVDWQNKQYEPMPTAAQANETFYKNGSLKLDNESIEFGFISQANTDGDIYVHFTDADVLVVGAMLGSDSYILLDYVTGGWIAGAQKTTAALIERATDATKVIAAHGGELGITHLQEQADMLSHAYEQVSWAFQNGKSVEELQAVDPMKDYRERWGDPALFLALLYKSTWYHVPGRAVRNVI